MNEQVTKQIHSGARILIAIGLVVLFVSLYNHSSKEERLNILEEDKKPEEIVETKNVTVRLKTSYETDGSYEKKYIEETNDDTGEVIEKYAIEYYGNIDLESGYGDLIRMTDDFGNELAVVNRSNEKIGLAASQLPQGVYAYRPSKNEYEKQEAPKTVYPFLTKLGEFIYDDDYTYIEHEANGAESRYYVSLGKFITPSEYPLKIPEGFVGSNSGLKRCFENYSDECVVDLMKAQIRKGDEEGAKLICIASILELFDQEETVKNLYNNGIECNEVIEFLN